MKKVLNTFVIWRTDPGRGKIFIKLRTILAVYTGSIISNQVSILKEIHTFYKTVYSNQDNVTQGESINSETFLNGIDIPRLFENEKIALEQPISKKEIYDVIMSMKTNKSPGFDGIPIELYVIIWAGYL